MPQSLSTGRHRPQPWLHRKERSVRGLCEWYWARHRATKPAAPVPAAVAA